MANFQAVPADVGAKGFDSLAQVTDEILKAAWDDGCRFVVRYVHSLQTDELECLARNRFAYMLVTYANNWSGLDARETALALGYPSGCTLWLDVESVSLSANNLINNINYWAGAVRPVFDPGQYVGCQSLLTWQELTQLAVDRYWASCSLVNDRNNQPSRPATDWNMIQLKPGNLPRYGTLVDLDIIQADTRGRVPIWAAPVYKS